VDAFSHDLRVTVVEDAIFDHVEVGSQPSIAPTAPAMASACSPS
jgi:isochorismate hydrolase